MLKSFLTLLKTKKRFFFNTVLFSGSALLNKAIPFLLLPVITNFLSPEDFGVVASFLAYLGTLAIVTKLSIHGSISVNFFKLEKKEVATFVFTALSIVFFLNVVCLVIVLIAADYLSVAIQIPKNWLAIGILASFATVIFDVHQTITRMQEKPIIFGFFQILNTALNVGISLVVLANSNLTFEGRIIGIVASICLVALVTLLLLIKEGYIHPSYRAKHAKSILNFGLPLIPHSISVWVKSAADKFLLINLAGKSSTGLFAAGFSIGQGIYFLTVALNNAYFPPLYKKLAQGFSQKHAEDLVKLAWLYFIGMALLGLIISISAKLIVGIFLNVRYLEVYTIIPWVTFAFVFQAYYTFFASFVFYFNANKQLARITFVNAAIHISLSFLLIKYWGYQGAAIASFVSYFLNFISVARLSQKIMPLPWLSIFRNR